MFNTIKWFNIKWSSKSKWILALMLVAELSAAESLDEMLSELTMVQNNSALLQASIAAGEDRSLLCVNCHGKDGNSVRDYIPNLASQNSAYLFKQFELFANGTRKDYVMSKLAKNLSTQDRIDIALFFASKDVKPRKQTVSVDPKGKAIYDSMCIQCHEAEGHGNGIYPRIAGQPYEYLSKTLKKFKSGHEDRKQSPMTAVVKNIPQDQLDAVASFIATMP